ncbi:MAG: transcriptional regulator, PadR-like family [Parcubacteria group bacterium]|nr:transcriptional regulator, PadR-like family [Parcubacteria group bacterium]
MVPLLSKVPSNVLASLIMETTERFASLRKGLLEFAVLNVISAEEAYAADILGRLSATDFQTQEGTLYPLLSKLRREGMLEYEWRESENGPPRKYYRLTAKGTQELKETEAYWKKLITTIKSLGASR